MHKQSLSIIIETRIIVFALFCFLLCIISCNKPNDSNNNRTIEYNENSKAQLDWLIGHWKRTNEQPDRETYETWKKNKNNTYSAIGYTISEGDTIFIEYMMLKRVNDKWNLIVTSPAALDSVVFYGKDSDENSFSVENLKNEFPQTIKYWKDNLKLMAQISNNEMHIDFKFERNEQL